MSKFIIVFSILFLTPLIGDPLHYPLPERAELLRMQHTEAINIHEVIERLDLYNSHHLRWQLENPYSPEVWLPVTDSLQSVLEKEWPYYRIAQAQVNFPGRSEVADWYTQRHTDESVCAIHFVDENKRRYELKTFSRVSEVPLDYVLTHAGHCGACSTLIDLAIYIDKPDLTKPARNCTLKAIAENQKQCMSDIGFTQACAEAWTYNGRYTKKKCAGICLKELLKPNTPSTPSQLNPCLACDEYVSGPGFKYSAGRTRRNSGLRSSIARDAAEIYPVDHRLYFFH